MADGDVVETFGATEEAAGVVVVFGPPVVDADGVGVVEELAVVVDNELTVTAAVFAEMFWDGVVAGAPGVVAGDVRSSETAVVWTSKGVIVVDVFGSVVVAAGVGELDIKLVIVLIGDVLTAIAEVFIERACSGVVAAAG